jgi:SUN domain-containing protein 1/2
MALNPNDSWASSTRTIVPRSTSVEYEKETQSTSTRRLNPPPRKGPPTSRSATTAAKLSKQQSVRYVPDSEGEDAREASQGRQERAKTPLESVVDLAKRTAFYLRQRSTEPELGPSETSQNGHHNNESYDYEAEERDFQSAATKGRKANNAALSKRGRISIDNKAYRPSQSDLEDSDDDVPDDGKRRRRKSKKGMIGPLTTLPVVGQEKRRRRRRGTKADGGEEEGDEQEQDSGSDSRVSPQVCQFIHLIAGLLALIYDRLALYPFVSATLPASGLAKTSISSFCSSRTIHLTSRTIRLTSSRTTHLTSRSIHPTATYVFRQRGPRLRRCVGQSRAGP